jgi:Fe-S cluster assembly protein SufD
MSIKGLSMTTNAQPTNPIQDSLKNECVRIAGASPSWLSEIRGNAWARFSELGIPTTKNEEWKYFNLAALSAGKFHLPASSELTDVKELQAYLNPDDLNIVFVNGVFSAKLSSIAALPKGVTVTRLSEAVQKNAEELKAFYKRSTVNDPEPFVSLNTALHQDGVFIQVADKAVVEQIIHIVHVSTGDLQDAAIFPRTFLKVGKSAQISILESFAGLSDVKYFINPVADIHLCENAVLNYYKAQIENAKAIHIGAMRIWQETNSQLEAFTMAAGAQMARNNISVLSQGEGTDSIVDGLYILSDTQIVDNHTLIDHQQPNCTSHQLYKGILNDASHAVFNGKIFVQPIAQKTNSYQLNKHLVLGKQARVDTKPQLEIGADDVKCTHGATIGQLNEDELFYLQTRCIGKDDAVRMLSRGFVDDILDKLRNQTVRQKLGTLLARKIAILR